MTSLQIALLQWDISNKRMLKVFESISDEKFFSPIIPNGNSPSWLLGHLADTDDMLLELFGIQKRMYPDLGKIYHHTKGVNQSGHLSKQELLTKWKQVLDALDEAFKRMTEQDWLSRHMAVSEEDFAKEPHRNKLNVMLSRVTHKASHLGQIAVQH